MTTKVGLYRERRNRSRPWIVRWFGGYDPATGKQRHYSQAFATKREAEAFQAAKQAELNRGKPRDLPRDITVGEFVHRFLESKVRNRRAATRYNYAHTLKQLVAFAGATTLIRMVTPEVADTFVATRERVAQTGTGYSSWSRNQHLGNMKIAFNVAVRWGYLATNPFGHIRRERCVPRKWHHLKPDEFEMLLEMVHDLRWRTFYLLAYTTGARFGELFNLTWTDINFERCTVTIRDRPGAADTPPFHVKDHEARTLLLPRQTVDALLAWQGEAPEGVPCVLLTAQRWQKVLERWRLCRARKPWKRNVKTGELEWVEWENRYVVNNVIRDMRCHFRKAGFNLIAPMTIHTFRKSFGQNHADAGTPVHVLQGLMGHASITTTREFYLQTADANEREALAKYQALLDSADGKTCVKLAYGQDCGGPAGDPHSVTHVSETTS
ncbi:MAG TPA: tyrosine-type recombinase/integrase [Phycisphaerae bacterium]|nr:tyrosine-type recombinase/integrase [Phycisphaerae bacterium]HRY67700.1 tyrosine-type recombinase/integrase [Phycisphaerae bacterium]HSA25151.1 tyrosine-type recombinase/integrase [Phycisphaerae bacterium]